MIRRPRVGVRARATIGTTAAFAFAIFFGMWFLVSRHQSDLTANVELAAKLRADDLAAAIAAGQQPQSVAIPVEDRAFVQIVDDRGAVVGQSRNVEGEDALVSFAAPEHGFRVQTVAISAVDEHLFRVVARRADHLTVYVGSSTGPVIESVNDLRGNLAVGGPVLLLIVAALSWIFVGRALRPVDAMRAEVDRISERQLHRRVPEPTTDDEVGRLASTLNRMLTRLEDSALQQRRFVADASHELRSPLTSIRALLEVQLAHPDGDWQATERDVLDETLRLHRLVEDLLVLAREDAPDEPSPAVLVDLDDVVLREVRHLRSRGRVDVHATGVNAVSVLADPDALTRVIHNLLDNAERHAHKIVTVTVHADGDTAELIVADDGLGVGVDLVDHVFERFGRADDARSRSHGGAGLGLSIAQQIATGLGGTLTLRPPEPGSGAAFVLRLPTYETRA